jgi:hypothetical protein
MSKSLTWTKEAFSRTIIILENGQPVGEMKQEGVLQGDVEARLNGVHLRFDVTGFIVHTVNLHDLANDNQIIGHIVFSFGKRAELQLTNGQTYLWKRHNMLMRDWDMIREGDNQTQEQEVVSYSLTRQFLAQHGDISVDAQTPDADIVVLTGLFIRNYFQRRRQTAAIAAGA